MDPASCAGFPTRSRWDRRTWNITGRIFKMECVRHAELSDEVFDFIVYLVTRGRAGACRLHPTFIVDQVTATCRFLGGFPSESPYVDYAINNLGVRRSRARMEAAQAASGSAAG